MGCLLAAPAARAASVTDLWPTQPAVASVEALDQRTAALEATLPALPAELAPAVRFEETFLRILARAPAADWQAQVRSFADAPGNDPVTVAVREAAKAWVARLQMEEIGKTLDAFYAQNVRFPATLAEVDRDIAKPLRQDPWGEPWTYSLHAPQGFARDTAQRYRLGPRRFPTLGTLREATAARRRPLTPPTWKVSLRVIGENRALEFSLGNATVGLVQAGGKIDAYTLAYVGDRWALMAGPDQLFTLAF